MDALAGNGFPHLIGREVVNNLGRVWRFRILAVAAKLHACSFDGVFDFHSYPRICEQLWGAFTQVIHRVIHSLGELSAFCTESFDDAGFEPSRGWHNTAQRGTMLS